MSTQIQTYLEALRNKLKGSDAAIVQDAMADAEEHLVTALAEKQAEQPDAQEDDLLAVIIEEYGTAEEISQAYRTVETYTEPTLAKSAPLDGNPLVLFFSVFRDPKAWGALLYMLMSLITGIFYFTWTLTGAALSISFSLFIFGLPLAAFFILSIRGLALVEGRIVEALLGERMPRRSMFAPKGLKWLDQLKYYLTDKATWFTLIYLILMLPLGIIYFTLFVTLLSLSLAFIAAPIVSLLVDLPIMTMGASVFYLTPPYAALMLFGGVLLMTLSMHIARGLGIVQGKIAKFVLVAGE